jgi:membrane protease YdiL (CAAX protease family)
VTRPTLAPPVALAVLVALLASANVVRSTLVPSGWHLAFNVGIGLAALALGLLAGLGRADLGLARRDLPAGVRLGAVAFVAVSAVVVVAGFAGLLTDDRADVSGGEVLVRALVVIPLGTVLVEELAFRGVLHGLLVRATSTLGVYVAGSLLFGLWHVVPAWRGGGVDTDVVALGRVALVAGTFAATSLAGVGFVWLRARSASLVAPALAHLATNSVTFALAWAFR